MNFHQMRLNFLLLLLLNSHQLQLFGLSASLRKKRRICVREIFQLREHLGEGHRLVREKVFSDCSGFFNYFRMSPSSMQELLELVGPKICKQTTFWRKPIEPAIRLAMTIRYLATGASIRSISFSFHVGYSYVLHNYTKYMPDKIAWEITAYEYALLWNFPNCIGSLDGKHIAIQAPSNAGSTFYNYKRLHSIVLTAMCDAKYRFSVIDVGGGGRQSDGGTFKSSPFAKMLEMGPANLPNPKPLPGTKVHLPYVIVADAAFPLKNIMRPFPGRQLNLVQRVFNYRLSCARRCIENAFGIMAARWRIYRAPILAHEDNVNSLVKASCCLHNFVMARNGNVYCPFGYADRYENGQLIPGEWRSVQRSAMSNLDQVGSNNYSENDAQIRECFAQYFISSDGELTWQYSCLRQ